MDTLIPFTDATLDKMVASSVDKFFETMLGGGTKFLGATRLPRAGNDPTPPSHLTEGMPVVVGMIGFIGSLNGVIYLHLEEDFAHDVTCAFLGMERAELDQDPHETVNDAIGEMANMIAGTFKNQLCDEGFNCRLTIPSILRGSRFTIETTTEVMRRVFRFQAMGRPLLADLLMKPGE